MTDLIEVESVFDYLRRVTAERDALQSRLNPGAMFEFIKHGDEEHQRWLREALEAWVAGGPKPEPRGLGKHGALIADLEAKLKEQGSRLGGWRKWYEEVRHEISGSCGEPPGYQYPDEWNKQIEADAAAGKLDGPRRALRASCERVTAVLAGRCEVTTECDHVVSHYHDGEDLGEVFFNASHYDPDTAFYPSAPGYETRFKFCPECGASLAEFWKTNKAFA